MTENNELGEVNFENQEERREDDCHDFETQKQNSALVSFPLPSLLTTGYDLVLIFCKDDIKSETEAVMLIREYWHCPSSGVHWVNY